MVMRIVSIIIFLLTLISAYGGKMNPEYLTFPAVLCLALPYFAILTGLLVIFWALNRKIIFTALGVVTILACAAPLRVAFPLSFSKTPEEN
ncbi:MAG: hypothetical protein K2M10_03045, partial [Muribaculaceae bacterium]|nr:hypothetical protein [Muribaculaceae bacterium]